MNTNFFFQKNTTLQNRNTLKLFIKTFLKKEKTSIKILNIIFCSDEYLLNINRDYLQHDYLTDIITFEITNDTKGKTAEIYISVDTVKKNAAEYQSFIKEELHRVVFHGVLHLCGYKDKTKKDIILMRQKENEYLKLYFN